MNSAVKTWSNNTGGGDLDNNELKYFLSSLSLIPERIEGGSVKFCDMHITGSDYRGTRILLFKLARSCLYGRFP